LKDHEVSKVKQVLKELQEHKVQQVRLVLQVQLELLEQPVLKVHLLMTLPSPMVS
jgi:hypothetical protein